ncbi:ssDNA-binding protein, partial [Xenorhabdus bovienii]
SIFAYDNNGKGISASLGGVQFYRDGDAFAGGGVASVDEFDDLSEGADVDADVFS